MPALGSFQNDLQAVYILSISASSSRTKFDTRVVKLKGLNSRLNDGIRHWVFFSLLANVLIKYLRADLTDAANEIIAAESLGVLVAYHILKSPFHAANNLGW